ncbi:hypothetical protein HN510_04515, partial [Candidatus Woesearchaeota archaeon]|nr:hypothetical protein [Candidatus Woesearchaeota archaeon]
MLSAVMSIHLLKRESNVAKTDFKKHIQIYKSKLELLSILVSDLSGRTHSFIEEKKIKGKSIRRSYRVQWSLSVVRRHIKKLYQLTNEDLAIDKSELDVSENTYKLFSKKAVSKAIIELKENLKVKNALKTEITEFTELHDNLFSQYKLILKIYNDLENITEEQYNILKKLIAKEGHLLIDIRKSEQEVVPIFRLYSRIKKKAMRNIMVLYHAYPAGSNPMIPHPLVRGSVV